MRIRRAWLRCDACRAPLPTRDATVTPSTILCPACAAATSARYGPNHSSATQHCIPQTGAPQNSGLCAQADRARPRAWRRQG